MKLRRTRRSRGGGGQVRVSAEAKASALRRIKRRSRKCEQGSPSKLRGKRIANRESAIDHLARLQVLGIERYAVRFESSRDDERVVDMEAVLFRQTQGRVMRLLSNRERRRTQDANGS